MTPAEDDELLAILLRNFFKELPKVFDKFAILRILNIIFRVFRVTAQKCDIWLTATTYPSFQVIESSHVQHALRNNLAKTTANGLHLNESLSKAYFECLANVLKPFLILDLLGLAIAIFSQIKLTIIS